MLGSYLKSAWRNLKRNWTYGVINTFGLAVGLAACLLIGLFILEERSFDQFHEHADRTFLAAKWAERGGEKVMYGTEYGFGKRLEENFPQVVDVTRATFSRSNTVKRGGDLYEEEMLYAGENFFEVFSFPLAKGDPETALTKPYSVVLTSELAQKYFNSEDPLGKTLTIDARGDEEEIYTVTGVTDPVPANTHLSFDLLLSGPTIDTNLRGAGIFRTYALLEDPLSIESLRQAPLDNLHDWGSDEYQLSFVPLPEVYLSDFVSRPGFRGNPRYLYLFSAIAAFVLLLAAINYANLATARSTTRAREVGIRKSAGASRRQVAGQFLGESILLSLLALVGAFGLAQVSLPIFNQLFDTSLTLGTVGLGTLLLGGIALALVVGLLAGSYPALYLSRFQPAEVLARQSSRGSASGSALLRQGLVVMQFAISVGLLIGTATVWQQLHYMQTKDLGFEEENVIVLPMGTEALKDEHETVKQELSKHPNVVGAAAVSAVPGDLHSATVRPYEANGEEKSIRIRQINADEDFLDLLGFRFVEGRNFSAEHPSDRAGAYVFNQEMVRQLEWENPVGKSFDLLLGEGTVVGVVEDFHVDSPRKEFEPVVFQLRSPNHESRGSYSRVVLRVRPEGTEKTLSFLEKQWERFAPEKPFEYSFLSSKFEGLYEAERRLSRALGVFAGLALLVACLGLFGLSAFASRERTREIGIRKALGATTQDIARLLSKEFLLLVALACALASPIAYFGMQRWLQNFAHRTELSLWLFAGAAGVALAIALLTTSYHALRAAWTDPAVALRDE